MKELHNTSGIIRTFSGKMINVFDPNPEDILIEDIAHALSNLCRFGGHTKQFYSVAQHCCLMAMLVKDEPIALATLLHDASEAYLLDIPRPIKHMLPQYLEAEDKLMRIIAKKYGFEYPLPEEVKQLDKQFLEIEWEWLMLGKLRPKNFTAWTSGYAKESFTELFAEILSVKHPSTDPESETLNIES